MRKNRRKMETLKDLVDSFKDPKYSSKTAIIDRKEYRRFTYSYKQLYDLCQRFASFLKENGVKKGDKIIVWAPNGVEYALIILGAFLEGVIIVPIDIRSDIGFVRKIQSQVNAKIVFQTKYKPKSTKIKTVFIEQIMDELNTIKIRKVSTKISENDIAEILYTSGTTGKPKGVILTNRNLVSNVNALNKIEKIKAEFKFLSVLPLSHIFEQTVEFFVPLSNKSTIAYIGTIKVSTLFKAFAEEKPTHMAIVPRLLQLIYSGILQKVRDKGKEKQFSLALKIARKLPYTPRKILFREIHKKFGNKLQYFICGGAPLDKELEQFYDTIGLPIVQGYGLTETSAVLTANLLEQRKLSSIGTIIPSVRIKINKEGEVLAKGLGMTQGYYKNPAKTKQLFEYGWLKTGDLGYIDKEGFLYLKGRKKDLIVTAAGVNVYPEDLEGVLNKISGVKDSCVIGRETEKGEEIYAVLLLEKGANKAKVKQIIAEANKELDVAQKIQGYSVWRDEDFPRTTTMKIKKFIVKEAIQKRIEKIKPVIAKGKNKIYDILSRLTTKKIIENRSLQDLGLSSIDRVELISLLEQELSVEIDEEKILPITTVKELGKMVKAKKRIEEKPIFKKWALFIPVRAVRFIAQKLFFFPFVWLYSKPKIKGKENLKGIKAPVIFASNHQSYFDTLIILTKLPLRFSQKTVSTLFQEYIFTPNLEFKNFKKRILFYFLIIFFNIYPFSRKRGFRRGIRRTGKLIDKGWNILIYPEGRISTTEKLLPFKEGIGLLGAEMKVPIVPIRISGATGIWQGQQRWPRSGRAIVKIGKPLIIKTDSYIEATNIVEKAIREL